VDLIWGKEPYNKRYHLFTFNLTLAALLTTCFDFLFLFVFKLFSYLWSVFNAPLKTLNLEMNMKATQFLVFKLFSYLWSVFNAPLKILNLEMNMKATQFLVHAIHLATRS
jgi:hypothetical protein